MGGSVRVRARGPVVGCGDRSGFDVECVEDGEDLGEFWPVFCGFDGLDEAGPDSGSLRECGGGPVSFGARLGDRGREAFTVVEERAPDHVCQPNAEARGDQAGGFCMQECLPARVFASDSAAKIPQTIKSVCSVLPMRFLVLEGNEQR